MKRPLKYELKSELKNPILDIAACFWEPERYQAFRVCYQSMRLMDDLVDDFKSSGDFQNDARREQVYQKLRATLESALESRSTLISFSPEARKLQQTIKEFKIPLWPWKRLFGSMEFDLRQSGFTTFLNFARYARGAAVSPASVFIHLIGLKKTGTEYTPAPVDCYRSARQLAMFSYMTHILRDFQKDSSEGLDYYPTRMKLDFAISDDEWRSAGAGNQSEKVTGLLRAYHGLSAKYCQRSESENNPIYQYLEPRYKFSLKVIWELYAQIHAKIEENNFQLQPDKIQPSTEEIIAKIQELAEDMKLDSKVFSEGLERLGVVGAKLATVSD